METETFLKLLVALLMATAVILVLTGRKRPPSRSAGADRRARRADTAEQRR